MYKRYSRKRHTYKKALSLGQLREIEKSKNDYDEYDFFHWFNDHLREYRAFHNNGDCVSEPLSDDDMSGVVTMVPRKYHQTTGQVTLVALQGGYHHQQQQLVVDDHNNKQTPDKIPEYSQQQTPNFHPTPIAVCVESQPPQQQQQLQQASSSTIQNTSENVSDTINNENYTTKPLVTSLNNSSNTSDDIFGQMIAAELKTFPENIKFRVKHELNNVIFNFRGEQLKSP